MRVRPALKGAEAAIREARHGRLTLTMRPIPRGGLDPASPSVLFVSRGRHRPFLRQEIPGSEYLEAWNVRPGARYHRAMRPCLLTHIRALRDWLAHARSPLRTAPPLQGRKGIGRAALRFPPLPRGGPGGG